ncbi:cytochrome B [Sphingomonas sp. WG]|nr:cytochrome B [Sphingomonas sp. WG]
MLLRLAIATSSVALTACNRHQSTLATFGEEASGINRITLVMVVGALVIAAAVAGLMAWAVRARPGALSLRRGEGLILIAGGLIPALVLIALLGFSLPYMRPRPVAAADLRIDVTGEQFWWRVAYRPQNGGAVTSANEIRIPVGRTVLFRLAGGDVVHSFWIPGLAGKMDMIPGRTNDLPVRATRPGRFRGQCTEFCGLSHALMAFDVVAMEPAAFDRWLAEQRRPAAATGGTPGAALFAQHGCGGCHAIRGTAAQGTIGPDLTHIGSRPTVAAGTLPNQPAALARFIRTPAAVKPGARMPSYPQMPEAEARAIAQYLGTLE